MLSIRQIVRADYRWRDIVDAMRITVYYTTAIIVAVGQVTEVEHSNALGHAYLTTQITSLNSALPITAAKHIIGTVVEHETANAIAKVKKTVHVAQVTETEIPTPVTHFVPLTVQGSNLFVPVDDRLAITITHADGTFDRWGPDEPDGRDIPDGLSFTTSVSLAVSRT